MERPSPANDQREDADLFATDETRGRVFPVSWGSLRVLDGMAVSSQRPALRSLPGLEDKAGVWHFTGRPLVDFDRVDVWSQEQESWEACHFWQGGNGGVPVFVCQSRWGTIRVHSGLLVRWRPSIPIEL